MVTSLCRIEVKEMNYELIDVSGKYAGSVPEVYNCRECGCLVNDQVAHDKFHQDLVRSAQRARQNEIF
jgi:hypothetical protein